MNEPITIWYYEGKFYLSKKELKEKTGISTTVFEAKKRDNEIIKMSTVLKYMEEFVTSALKSYEIPETTL